MTESRFDDAVQATAGFGKTCVWVGRTKIDLPDYTERHGGGSAIDKQVGETCPIHFVATSLTGVCADCD